tara:strand:+ start:1362 stop:1961 length:600 start_codon:yes stop_codon:yes gene_type:complete
MIVLDDYIEDDELLKAIGDGGSVGFWDEGYHWWDGWWVSKGTSLRHDLIEYIWRYHCPAQMAGIEIAGFEFWTGIFSKDQIITNDSPVNKGYALNHHFDKDEGHFQKTGVMNRPKVGTIYYPPMGKQCDGGYLKIYKTKDMDVTAPYELIEPKANRLVIFDAGQLHAVMGISSGIRHSVAINLWENHLSDEQREVMTVA